METEALSNLKEIEEGEIEDIGDPEELYIPLERPVVPSINISGSKQVSDNDDNNSNQSSSDSDSSSGKTSRKKIVPQKSKQLSQLPAKRKNYNIWCADIQTEVLTNNLVECNVDQSVDRTRDVETYNYKISSFLNDSDDSRHSFTDNKKTKKSGFSTKRRHDGNYVDGKKKGVGKKGSSRNNSKERKGSSRTILPLSTTVNDSEADIARDIANKLYEEKEDLILNALNIVGKEQIIALFEETKEVEEDGGMLIMNGVRRRTPGGVFLYLLKSSTTIPRDKINLVFEDDRKLVASERKRTFREKKQLRSAKFKEALSKDDFPTLLTHTEMKIRELKARKMAEESGEVKNPPPSPATDGRENSSDGEEQKYSYNCPSREVSEGRSLTCYDDNPFDGGEDMEIA